MIYIPFRDYLLSKDELLGRLEDDPVILIEYEMVKYSKISIGESLNVRDMFILKPKERIKVQWNYIVKDNPACMGMIIGEKLYSIYWKDEKIIKWISRNCKEL